MPTWLYDNPLGIAFSIVAMVFLLSVIFPADTWDRLGYWLWRSPSDDQSGPQRRMPWEKP